MILAISDQAGQLLAAQRKMLKLSQADVAIRLGISQSRYSELEANPGLLTLDRLLHLVGILGLDLLLQEKTPLRNKIEW